MNAPTFPLPRPHRLHIMYMCPYTEWFVYFLIASAQGSALHRQNTNSCIYSGRTKRQVLTYTLFLNAHGNSLRKVLVFSPDYRSGKLMPRRIKQLMKNHSATPWPSQDLIPGLNLVSTKKRLTDVHHNLILCVT